MPHAPRLVAVIVPIVLFMAGVSAHRSQDVEVVPHADSTDCEMARREKARTARQACDLTLTADAATAARLGVERELVNAQIVAAGLLAGAVAAGLLAGAVAAGLIPVLGQFLAPARMNAYLVAQARVVYFLGRISVAAGAESRARTEWERAWRAFNSAQTMLYVHSTQVVAKANEASFRPRCSPWAPHDHVPQLNEHA